MAVENQPSNLKRKRVEVDSVGDGTEDEASASKVQKVTANINSAQEDRCYLLELPAELQLQIYELVFTYDRPIKLKLDYQACTLLREDRYRRVQPPLSRTCKQIREDALTLYYQHNTFQSHYFNMLHLRSVCQWLEGMGATRRFKVKLLQLDDLPNIYGALIEKPDLYGCRYHITFPKTEVE